MTNMGQLEKARDEKRAAARAKAQAKKQTDGWRGFVNYELAAHEKAEAKKLLESPERVWANVFGLISDGYKMTLSFDEQRDAYNLSMTGKSSGTSNDGLTLSGRGGSELAAAVSFWYKHREVFDGVWRETSVNTGGAYGLDDFD